VVGALEHAVAVTHEERVLFFAIRLDTRNPVGVQAGREKSIFAGLPALVAVPHRSTLVASVGGSVGHATRWAGLVASLDPLALMWYIEVMAKRDKILDTLLRGTSDANIGFSDLCGLLKRLGFSERVRGDHHFFSLVMKSRKS